MGRKVHDFNIVDPNAWADNDQIHDTLKEMRHTAPIAWMEPEGFRPFYAITRYEDIVEIEKLNNQFLNGPRSILLDAEYEEVPAEQE